jgi:tight adherence protein C
MGFAFVIIVALFGGIGKKIDNKNRRIKAISNQLPIMEEDLEIPFVERFFMPVLYKLLKLFSRLLPKNNQKETSPLENKIKQAGIMIPIQEYIAAKLIVMLGTIGLAFILVLVFSVSPTLKFFILLLGGIAAVLGPNMYLSTRIKNRQGAIRNQMPDIMDLLTVCVEAGLGFDAALLKINERFEGPLVDELMIVQREIQMALPRKEALKKFSDRNDIPELKTFVGALIQADQMGLSMKNVLKVQSSQLRLARKQIAEEKAMKAPIKMMLPLVFFVFPVIFIVLLGPTVLQMIKTFGN